MKRFSVFVFSLFMFLVNSRLSGQGSADAYLYVTPNTPSAYPSTGSNFTGSSTLDNILNQHQVVSYVESFPGAPTSSFISNAYEIHLDGDYNSLYNALNATGMFDLIEAAPYYRTAGSEPTSLVHQTG